jgi:hypothetical protein
MVRGLVCLLYAHWLRNAEFDGDMLFIDKKSPPAAQWPAACPACSWRGMLLRSTVEENQLTKREAAKVLNQLLKTHRVPAACRGCRLPGVRCALCWVGFAHYLVSFRLILITSALLKKDCKQRKP